MRGYRLLTYTGTAWLNDAGVYETEAEAIEALEQEMEELEPMDLEEREAYLSNSIIEPVELDTERLCNLCDGYTYKKYCINTSCANYE